MNVGDWVSWTQARVTRNTMTISSLEGKIVRIEGEKAVVRRNRKLATISLARLRLASERSELTEMILGKKPEGG
jgi:hypothetical protein